MTIFDVLRYPVTDIYELEQLDPLPKEVLEKWRVRCINYAIEKAESVALSHNDSYVRKCINSTKQYMQGEISAGDLELVKDAYPANGFRYEYLVAKNCIRAAVTTIDWVAYYAVESAYWAGGRRDSVAVAAKELCHKWLIEELTNYEGEQ